MSLKLSMITKNSNYKQILMFIVSFILFWGYIFRFKLVGFPYSTSTFLCMGGIIFLFIKLFFKKKITLKTELLTFIVGLIIPWLFLVMSSLLNGTTEFSIMKYLKSIPSCLLAFYCFKSFKNTTNKKLSFNDIALLFILTGFVQCIISLIGFLIPSFGEILIDIQEFSDDRRDRAEFNILNRRLLGLGTGYFPAGINFSVDLILITQLLLDTSLYKEKYYKYLPLFYLVIFACGMMMSRTTIVGLFFSLFFFFKNTLKKVLHTLKAFSPAFLLLLLLTTTIFYNYGERALKLFSFGFELFINLASEKGFQTSSSNASLRMYLFPEADNYKTWLIGDALFNNPDGSYYMHTDIGYCRSIFCFGLLGTLSLLLTQSLMVYMVMKKIDSKYRYFLFILGLMFLTFNLKGFVLIHLYLIPFYFIDRKEELYTTIEGDCKYA